MDGKLVLAAGATNCMLPFPFWKMQYRFTVRASTETVRLPLPEASYKQVPFFLDCSKQLHKQLVFLLSGSRVAGKYPDCRQNQNAEANHLKREGTGKNINGCQNNAYDKQRIAKGIRPIAPAPKIDQFIFPVHFFLLLSL